jgi:Rrf2 family protein
MLSQATKYATTALGCVAAMGGKPVLIKVVAEACGTPQAYLAKIVNLLAHRNLVLTQRGVGGGVTLARPAEEISLFDVCQALADPITEPKCMLGEAECRQDRACPAHDFCTQHREKLAAFLGETTIADIAAFETQRRWTAAAEAR